MTIESRLEHLSQAYHVFSEILKDYEQEAYEEGRWWYQKALVELCEYHGVPVSMLLREVHAINKEGWMSGYEEEKRFKK
jgi:hypothetical protein